MPSTRGGFSLSPQNQAKPSRYHVAKARGLRTCYYSWKLAQCSLHFRTNLAPALSGLPATVDFTVAYELAASSHSPNLFFGAPQGPFCICLPISGSLRLDEPQAWNLT